MRIQGNGDSQWYKHLKNNLAEFSEMQNMHFCKPNSFASRYIYLREMIKYVDLLAYCRIFFSITTPEKQTKSPLMEQWLTKRSSYSKHDISTQWTL